MEKAVTVAEFRATRSHEMVSSPAFAASEVLAILVIEISRGCHGRFSDGADDDAYDDDQTYHVESLGERAEMLSEYVKTDGVKNIGHGEVNLMVDSIGDNIEISRHVADVQAGVQAGDVIDTWVVRWLTI